MDGPEYKKRKEDFVSGLTGGSAGEVNLVTAVAPIALLAWSVLQRRQSFFRPYTTLSLTADFLLNVAGILLATTLYAGQPVLLNGVLLGLAALVWALPANVPAKPKPTKPKPTKPKTKLSPLPKKPFLTAYRGCMLVITCLAILAVDFRIFPRRFAKVETWGTSLMDMGVGSFVFSGGVVAARPLLKERGRPAPLARRLLSSLRHALPLLVLGVVRLLSVKGLDYAEHVTEYGVHWNFFFTLGLLPPFVALAQAALRLVPSYAVLALALAAAYEAVLDHTGLGAYVLTAPRVDLVSRNREGICSFVGYLAIFLAGQDTGLCVLPRGSIWGRRASSGNLVARAVLWALLYQLAIARGGLGLTESRRLANLPYVLWVLSFNTAQLLLFALVETSMFPAFDAAADDAAEQAAYREATSPVLDAFNRNGLAVFLLANLLTGFVNLTVPTLDVSAAAATGILLGYGAVLTGVALALDRWDVTIRL